MCIRDSIRTGGVCPGIYLSTDVFAQVQRGLLNVMRAYLERPACYELCCAGPVSYTHLDVYKRQQLENGTQILEIYYLLKIFDSIRGTQK